MFDEKTMYAIGMTIARTARIRAEEPTAKSNEIIDLTPLLRPWKPGHYKIGEVCIYEGYPYRCVQEHDSTPNPSWTPTEARTLWANYHATDKVHALPFIQPTGAHDAYNKGEFAIWEDGIIMESIVDGNAYSPVDYPPNWQVAE